MARGGEGRTFSYGSGAERIDDGRFVYEFDARGRLISATEKAAGSAPQSLRRILYYYSAADRVVGRRAEYAAPSTGPVTTWKLEDRAAILDADALPAEVTFVWDPISDTLVTVAALNGHPLRQIIQGGNGYDDPIEVAVAENSTVHRLHPVFDEAGAGTLQIILNENGEVISRTVEEGAYGEDEYGLAGAAVDRIAIAAMKTSSGALQSVTVSIRSTEQLAASTIATGARLAVVDASGAVVRSSPTNATLFENYTLRWTLTAEEWTALTSSTGNPQRLSIAVTKTLRAAAWDANHAILPAPDWAPTETMHSSTSLPVEYRASLTELDSWISRAAPSEKTLFEATSLSALGGRATPAARLIFAAGFQALPFTEPATGLVYARDRWYDPGTGTFLSPDPLGYRDSFNLYAFCAGDPINCSDPTGEFGWSDVKRGWKKFTKWFSPAPKGSIDYPDNPRDGETRAQYVDRLWSSGINFQEAAAAGATFFSEQQPDPVMFGAVTRGVLMAQKPVYAMYSGLKIASSFTGIGATALVTEGFVENGVTPETVTMAVPLALHLAVSRTPAAIPSVIQGAAQTDRAITGALDAQRALARITEEVNARLAANPSLARTVLSRGEYEAATRSANMARMAYGNAVERLVARQVRDTPELAEIFEHVGGPNNPDFVVFGQNYDITTENMSAVWVHMRRPGYGPGLSVVTYQRPAGLTTFPTVP